MTQLSKLYPARGKGEGNMARAIKFDREQMQKLRMEGKPLAEIASIMNCSLGTVSKVMQGFFGKRDKVGRRPTYSHSNIIEAYKRDQNMTTVAKEFNCSAGTVRNVILKAGIPIVKPNRKKVEVVAETVEAKVEAPAVETPVVVVEQAPQQS